MDINQITVLDEVNNFLNKLDGVRKISQDFIDTKEYEKAKTELNKIRVLVGDLNDFIYTKLVLRTKGFEYNE